LNNTFDNYVNKMRELGNLIRSGEVEVEKVNQYIDLKLDIDDLLKLLNNFVDVFQENEKEFYGSYYPDKIYTLPSVVLSSSKTSFISPAYTLNQYLDNLNLYTLNDFSNNQEERRKAELQLNIYVQTLFSSVKTLLDRLIPLLSFYYPGISVYSTFGRIEESGKAKGLMSKVIELKEKDLLMMFIYNNYNEWIKAAVLPRDLLVHYNDFSTKYQYTIDGRTIPIHLEVKLFENSYGIDDNGELIEPMDHYYKSLNRLVDKTYNFICEVLNLLIEKEISLTFYHFKSKELHQSYKEEQTNP